MSTSGITLVGLGPGNPSLLTRQAWDLLRNIPEIYLRSHQHPTVVGFPPTLRVKSFDYLYQDGESFEYVYDQIVEQILNLGERPEGVVYAVPGHPFVAEATTPQIASRARKIGVPVRVVEGLSFLESTFAALEVDPFPHTTLIDALELAATHHPSMPPDRPAMIAQLYSPFVASEVKLTLMAIYPENHLVKLVHGAGTTSVLLEEMPLFEIDRSPHVGLLTTLYVPSLGENTSFEAFQELVAHLRAPEGCPWDREQTHQSLRPHLLEEAYEVLAALDAADPNALREELGDLLLQIVLHAQIASEYGEFTMSDILQTIHVKLVHRHPHVFGDLNLQDAQEVIQNWERLKADERRASGVTDKGLLDGVAITLPALSQAAAFQKRVARVGFDWTHVQGVMDKIDEELGEVRQTSEPGARAEEIGDLLFAVVNLARWFDVDAESALREANHRFRERFAYIESHARSRGRELSQLSLEEMNDLWNQAKQR
ncbi:MAG TPA: nucleoside triphosphate pyrophosphohydrolase [Anaerolineales bacterium]|nr:nucleoside triphosphate pyrophosphohydrolase [Anaerolineales bacterium]